MNILEKRLNGLFILIIACVLLGGFGVQFLKHEKPCPLCLLQRLSMIGMATGALMNIRFGITKAHYGLILLAAVFGGFVALRQFLLHVCPGFSSFGTPFWGLSLYTWSFIVHVSSVTYVGLLLLIFDQSAKEGEVTSWNAWGLVAFTLIFLVTVANMAVTFWMCGLLPCKE